MKQIGSDSQSTDFITGTRNDRHSGGIVDSILLAMHLPMFTIFDQIQQSIPIYSLQKRQISNYDFS